MELKDIYKHLDLTSNLLEGSVTCESSFDDLWSNIGTSKEGLNKFVTKLSPTGLSSIMTRVVGSYRGIGTSIENSLDKNDDEILIDKFTLEITSKISKSDLNARAEVYNKISSRQVPKTSGLKADLLTTVTMLSTVGVDFVDDIKTMLKELDKETSYFVSGKVNKLSKINRLDLDSKRKNLSNVLDVDSHEDICPISKLIPNSTVSIDVVKLIMSNSNVYRNKDLEHIAKHVKKISAKIEKTIDDVRFIFNDKLSASDKEKVVNFVRDTTFVSEYIAVISTFFYLHMQSKDMMRNILTEYNKEI